MAGDRVCVAGVDSNGVTWRPEPENRSGVYRSDLSSPKGERIRPGSVIEFFGQPKDGIEPPHIEDFVYQGRMRRIREVDDVNWSKTMRATLFSSVRGMFDGFIEQRRFVPPDSPTRSLGTIVPPSKSVELRIEDVEKPTIRLSFSDQSGVEFSGWAVNDLALAEYVINEVKQGISHRKIESEINTRFAQISELYLRIGLTRPWSASGPEQCWAQITAIHTSRPPRYT